MKKIKGIVRAGNKLGGKLGFPTANLDVDACADIENGVYAARVNIDGVCHNAVANVGYRPSVSSDASERVLEVHILGYSGSLYGEEIEVGLLEYMRPEVRFASLDELKRAIENDINNITEYFKRLNTCS